MNLFPNLIAFSWTTVVSEIVEVVDAVVLSHKVEIFLWDQVKVENGLWETWRDIKVPVGGTIANHHTLEVDVVSFSGLLNIFVVVVDLPGHVRNVNSSVTLTRDENLMVLEFWELREPVQKGINSILGLNGVVGSFIGFGSGNGESNTGWGLDVEHVGVFVP